LKGELALTCPVCDHKDSRQADWCPACGAYLGLLRRNPRRVAYCVCASIGLGLVLFCALAWEVFGPLLRGWPTGSTGARFWWGFVSATFFLSLGLTARQHLAAAVRRMFAAPDA